MAGFSLSRSSPQVNQRVTVNQMFGIDFLAKMAANGQNRREDRTSAEGNVRINGRNYALADWSSSGFQAGNYDGRFSKGDKLSIEFNIDIGAETYFFECDCFIVRVDDGAKHFAGVFVEMDEIDRQAVVQYFEELGIGGTASPAPEPQGDEGFDEERPQDNERG